MRASFELGDNIFIGFDEGGCLQFWQTSKPDSAGRRLWETQKLSYDDVTSLIIRVLEHYRRYFQKTEAGDGKKINIIENNILSIVRKMFTSCDDEQLSKINNLMPAIKYDKFDSLDNIRKPAILAEVFLANCSVIAGENLSEKNPRIFLVKSKDKKPDLKSANSEKKTLNKVS